MFIIVDVKTIFHIEMVTYGYDPSPMVHQL